MAAAVAAIQAGSCQHGALAAERGCPGLSIQADASFRSHWPDVFERVDRELSVWADVDPCARVELRVEGEGVITVSVSLPDGRAASRRLTQGDDVIPTLQALLLVPEPGPPAPAVASPATAASPHGATFINATSIDATSRTERDAPPATTRARSLGFELSLSTGARVGNGQLGLGVGALSSLELNGWLIGFQGRADSYRSMAGEGRKTALELGILAGRRFDLGSVALDLSAGPAAAMMGFDEPHSRTQSVSVSRETNETMIATPAPVQPSNQRSGPVPRLLVGARLGFNPRSVVGTFVGIDGEVGPALASADPSSARLPAYCVGFSLGATLGTP